MPFSIDVRVFRWDRWESKSTHVQQFLKFAIPDLPFFHFQFITKQCHSHFFKLAFKMPLNVYEPSLPKNGWPLNIKKNSIEYLLGLLLSPIFFKQMIHFVSIGIFVENLESNEYFVVSCIGLSLKFSWTFRFEFFSNQKNYQMKNREWNEKYPWRLW